MSGAGNSYAIFGVGDIVFDPAQLAKMVADWYEQGSQWVKEYNQWKQQYDAFTSQMQNMQSLIGLPGGTTFEKVNEKTFMVEESCGEAYGGGFSGLLGRFTGIDLRGDMFKQRYDMCANIQMMKNRKYNEMVDYMTETNDKMNASLSGVYNKFVTGNLTQGDMSQANLQMQKANAEIQKSNEQFQARMQAYDTYIAVQTSAQGSLTKTAMRGNAGLIKKLATTAALGAALCGGGQCSD